MRRATLTSLGLALAALLMLGGCERPPVDSVQRGYRGTGMDQLYNPRTLEAQAVANQVPEPLPAVSAEGPRAKDVFKNVQVLGDSSVAEFTRTMAAMTAWVAPEQGCVYCHAAGKDLSEDALYTKVVARKMLEMTRHINTDFKSHVADTGVTCFTCHRGQPVPAQTWFSAPPHRQTAGMVGDDAGQNSPAKTVGLTSLPYDPFTAYLSQAADIRVVGDTPLPSGNRKSIKQTEGTYGLMVHMSESLGVNCTYCHNSRSFSTWDQSTPQRMTAWHGIRMARDLNVSYLEPLTSVFPAARNGPTGDVAKINCSTCHQGAYKPLYGASLLKDHPELAGGTRVSVAAPAAAGATAAQSAVLFFDVGSSSLAGDAAKALEPVIQALQSSPDAKAVLSGYHSAAGTLSQNQGLAKQRAFAVRDALKAAGIAEDRIVLEKPQSAEANLSGEDPAARRVEVALR
ncbi:photosynthetic reaction center cytochrome PufC [Methylibium petroleiphilum]|uniref:photosynthetic reaction center cytochrome PufC n=1 Tax=Methylibium petroleiphilum TaxID=105560 RepID=UPI001AD32238|nr:photosynthetic reaction center cytochrome PufC [Methylibium petroleiphilum]MBN9205510.1 photosynthetic reaction center cytochrome c subunit [Methylibium petroleiphilum]